MVAVCQPMNVRATIPTQSPKSGSELFRECGAHGNQ